MRNKAARNERARALRLNQSEAESGCYGHSFAGAGLCGAKFRRQHPIGPFFADFCCTEAVVIELDGGQHALSSDVDAGRTAYLNALGYTVLRFWNNQIFQELEGVLSRIATAIDSTHGHACDRSDPRVWGEG